MEINITKSAIEQVKHLMESENKSGFHLRVAAVGGGCSGIKYDLSFDNTIKESDKVVETNEDLKILVDKRSLLYLIGTELDYNSGLNGKGFEWKNPNATRTCGCGESFDV
jgi:iron-sulfur cluster assembly protein